MRIILEKIKQASRAKVPVPDSPDGFSGDSDNLMSWWQTQFTSEEQNYILGKGFDLNRIIYPDGSLGFTDSLAMLSTWFITGGDVPLARRILAKSVEMQESETGAAIDRHFIYDCMIRVYYRDRKRDEDTLDLAIQACQKQIALAPHLIRERPKDWGNDLPAHRGFQQLAVILERDNDYEGTISLCEQALQQGWAGDWGKRIARCQKRMNRQSP